MGTVRSWWRKLMGREPAKPVPRPATAAPKAPKSAGLELSDAPAPSKPTHVGAAGFDPYSSDAGYSKPHSWERVDHD